MKLTPLTTFFTLFLTAIITNVLASSLDVFVPPVSYPHNDTVWIVGQHHNVTWDISNRPVNITNPVGLILLAKGGIVSPLILADNFNILLGRITVQVPWVLDGDNYQVVLLGDSGNLSANFTITGSNAEI